MASAAAHGNRPLWALRLPDAMYGPAEMRAKRARLTGAQQDTSLNHGTAEADLRGTDRCGRSDDEGFGREQPEPVAILACYEPDCERYFGSFCHGVLLALCPMFHLRWVLCNWQEYASDAFFRRMHGMEDSFHEQYGGGEF